MKKRARKPTAPIPPRVLTAPPARPRKPRVPLRRDGPPDARLIIVPAELRSKCGKQPVLRDMVPTAIGHYPNASGHFIRRRETLDEYIFIYCTDSEGWCRFRGRSWRIHPNQAILVPRNTPHSYGASRERPWSIYWVHFTGRRADDYAELLTSRTHGPLLSLPRLARLSLHFEELLDLTRRGLTLDTLIGLSTHLCSFFGLVCTHQCPESPRMQTREQRIRETIEFMQREPSTRPTLKTLATRAGLSVTHYIASFRELTGYSPKAFQLRLKIQHACRLLTTTDFPVNEVSRSLGFDDPYYFSRLFKKIMGQSPLYYRNKQHQFRPPETAE